MLDGKNKTILDIVLEKTNDYIDDSQYLYNLIEKEWLIVMKMCVDANIRRKNDNMISGESNDYLIDKLIVIDIINVIDPSIVKNKVEKKYCYYNNSNYDLDIYEKNKLAIFTRNGVPKEKMFICKKKIIPAFFDREKPKKYTGMWISYSYDNPFMIKTYLNGELEGKCVFTDTRGYYTEYYKNNKLDGEYIRTNGSGGELLDYGHYKCGNKTGKWIEAQLRGSAISSNSELDKDQIEGTGEYLYSESTNESNRNGQWIFKYKKTGKILLVNYENGHIDGQWYLYADDSKKKLLEKREYIHDNEKIYENIKIYKNKTVIAEGKIDENNIVHWKYYHLNGKIKFEGTESNEKNINDECKFYDKNGTILASGKYYKNERCGKWYYYNTEGKMCDADVFNENSYNNSNSCSSDYWLEKDADLRISEQNDRYFFDINELHLEIIRDFNMINKKYRNF